MRDDDVHYGTDEISTNMKMSENNQNEGYISGMLKMNSALVPNKRSFGKKSKNNSKVVIE